MNMKIRDFAVIAAVLGEERPAPEIERWLRSADGRREMAAYRRTLGTLQRAYGRAAAPPAPVYYDSLPAPIGRVMVAATPTGLVRVSFRRSEAAFTAELRDRLRQPVVKSPAHLRPVTEQLQAYFGGGRRAFDVPVDLSHLSTFQRRVLQATRGVRAGKVVSYADIARRIGQPRASRAVGQALGHNPVPIVIPCHRVVASDGTLGGYTGGLTIKKRLLRIEGALCA